MSNHKYFLTVEEYDQWIKSHRNVFVVDRISIDKGLYIEYMQGIYKEEKHCHRKRSW